jgi:hypothetical protein
LAQDTDLIVVRGIGRAVREISFREEQCVAHKPADRHNDSGSLRPCKDKREQQRKRSPSDCAPEIRPFLRQRELLWRASGDDPWHMPRSHEPREDFLIVQVA